MEIPEFTSRDSLTKLWWLHDSFWHAALVKEFGLERATQINLEVAEKLFRMMTNQLLREKVIQRPRSIQDLLSIFKVVWKNAFFDNLYINEPIHYDGAILPSGSGASVMSMMRLKRRICSKDMNAAASQCATG